MVIKHYYWYGFSSFWFLIIVALTLLLCIDTIVAIGPLFDVMFMVTSWFQDIAKSIFMLSYLNLKWWFTDNSMLMKFSCFIFHFCYLIFLYNIIWLYKYLYYFGHLKYRQNTSCNIKYAIMCATSLDYFYIIYFNVSKILTFKKIVILIDSSWFMSYPSSYNWYLIFPFECLNNKVLHELVKKC